MPPTANEGSALCRQAPPLPGLEPAADRFGGAGELGRVRRQLGLVDQLAVALERCIDGGFAAPELGDSVGLAGLGGEIGQPLEGGIVRGLKRRATPRGRLARPGRRRSGRRARRGAKGASGAEPPLPADGLAARTDVRGLAGGPGPLQAGVPDRGVVAAALARTCASQRAGLIEPAGAGCQVGQPQPDEVVVGSGLVGLGQRDRDPVDRIRVAVDAPELAQGLGWIGRLLGSPPQDARCSSRRPVIQ